MPPCLALSIKGYGLGVYPCNMLVSCPGVRLYTMAWGWTLTTLMHFKPPHALETQDRLLTYTMYMAQQGYLLKSNDIIQRWKVAL